MKLNIHQWIHSFGSVCRLGLSRSQFTESGHAAVPVLHHLNGWEFLQWLITTLGEGIQWAWDEHPILSLVFALLLIGLILVFTGHLDGAALWKFIAGP
jgi:hypothetical protein